MGRKDAMYNEIRERLAATPVSDRADEVRRLAKEYNLSPATIYANTRSLRASRKGRADRGIARTPEPGKAQLDWMFSLTTLNDMAAPEVCAQARAARTRWGGAFVEVSPAQYNSILRTRGVTRRILSLPEPTQRWTVAAPGFCELDYTVIEQVYIEKDEVLWEEEWRLSKTRVAQEADEKRTRLRVYAAIMWDKYSGLRYRWAYRGMCEDFVLDFIFRWCEAFGIPGDIYTDKDPCHTARIVEACERLGIKLIKTAFPWAKGGVERMAALTNEEQKITKTWKWESLQDLRDYLTVRDNGLDEEKNINGYNYRRHTRTGERPMDRYFAALPASRVVFIPPEANERGEFVDSLLDKIFRRPEEMFVRPGPAITIGGVAYQLPYREPFLLAVNARATFLVNPKRPGKCAMVYKNQEYPFTLTPMVAGSRVEKREPTRVQQFKAAMKQVDMGERPAWSSVPVVKGQLAAISVASQEWLAKVKKQDT